MHGGIEQKARSHSRQRSSSSLSRMHPSFAKTEQTPPRPFLLLKRASEAEKYQNERSENWHHLMRFASNDAAVE